MSVLARAWRRIRCLGGRHRYKLVPSPAVPSEDDLWETLFTGVFPRREKCIVCGRTQRHARTPAGS